jgi:mRNA-degrading endonuclease RelE of RelBE toxin-antitoxin system
VSEAGEPFEIHWASPARRALNRLPEKVAAAAVEFIIDDRQRRVYVEVIGHRADIYR